MPLLYLSSSCWNTDSFKDFMEAAEQHGIWHIELSGGLSKAPDRAEHFQEYISRGFVFKVHNYYPPPSEGHFILNIASPEEELRMQSVAFAKRSIDLAKALDSCSYSIHSGYTTLLQLTADGEHFAPMESAQDNRKVGLEALARSMGELCAYCRRRNMLLALENQFPPPEGANYALMCDREDISRAVKQLQHLDQWGFLFDIDHANISARILGFALEAFAADMLSTNRVIDLHISGNQGTRDDHSLPVLHGELVRILQKTYVHVGQATLETRNVPFEDVANHYHQLRLMLDYETP